jgi:DNA-binding NarL/FixJ family response regulator
MLLLLLVDDSLAFRRSVCKIILEHKQDFQVVGEASDGLEAVQKAEELQPDLILLDIGPPKLNGIEAAKCIGEVAPSSTILFVTTHSDADIVRTALSNGAMGYLLKTDACSELWPAIEAVLQGKPYISSGLRSPVQARSRDSAPLVSVPAPAR